MIFFDLDGVLIDSNGVWVDVDLTFAKKRGLTVTEEYTYTVGHSIFPVAAQFTKDYYQLPESPQEIMDEWRALAHEAYAHTIPMKPGARELLDKLSASGKRLALLTASLPELCRAALARHGLECYFEGLFFAQETGLEKKNPEVYRMAATQFGVAPDNCVLLEDAPHNCAAAKAAGFQVVGVYDEFYDGLWPLVMENSHRAVRSLEALL